ncbi:MAG: hypothetical protein JWM68_2706 [Verrucomicrobiales bacterium]|nr:hypothetical protein [Verrucomicrobiales bacterium]
MKSNYLRRVLTLTLLLSCLACQMAIAKPSASKDKKKPAESWRGVHLFVASDEAVDDLSESLTNLTAVGINTIILEVGYNFEFKSHPELRSGRNPVTRAHARKLAAVARKNGVRLIPELDCLGHQSWKKSDHPLLRVYPQFMEPIGTNTDTNGAHLHSWCPQQKKVYPIIFSLMDELMEAFDADAFHVGMDEVFCIASDKCPRCKGADPAKLYAKAVNDLHKHIVGKRKKEMLMWGDRLLDSKALGYSKWEASRNGTHGAIDLIPKDIVVCDWHYEKSTNYPSVPLLLEKGFRVWPSGWQPLEATKAFSAFSLAEKNPRLVGYLVTAWSRANVRTAATWPPLVEVMKDWKK